MSQHIVTQEEKKFVFGWDQPLQSFYLQVHNTTRPEDDQIVAWQSMDMYEVEDLVRKARKQGLDISYKTQVQLYGEKDDGR